jgi:hypothetical protein
MCRSFARVSLDNSVRRVELADSAAVPRFHRVVSGVDDVVTLGVRADYAAVPSMNVRSMSVSMTLLR